MKLIIEKSPFLKALSHGQSVVEKRTTVPILSHVLLTAIPNKLLLTSTDMDIALIETVSANVEEPGTISVPAHLLYEVVRKLSDTTPITLNYNPETSQLTVSSGRSRFELPSLPSDDFPQLTHSDLTHHFTLPAPILKHLIDTTRFAMSTEETRYHLNGIHFHTLSVDGKNILRAVATDMHRLACVECEAPEGSIGMPEIIIGRKTITEIRKLLDEAEQPVQIGISGSRVEFALEGTNTNAVLSSRLVDGTFPDYQAAMAIENDKVLIVSTKAFAEAVDRVGTVVNDKVRAIKLKISENSAVLSAVSTDSGSAVEELDVDFAYNDAFEICFNVRYLIDIAQQISTDEIEFLLADGESSVLLRPINSPNSTFILMPMRV
ncbi:MAG: DNA polymerase III subunit beta [Alphaproteobacteria bacterium]|nr:DNA polymerase III subunit beta [Alphaproteobacteria bacterium]